MPVCLFRCGVLGLRDESNRELELEFCTGYYKRFHILGLGIFCECRGLVGLAFVTQGVVSGCFGFGVRHSGFGFSLGCRLRVRRGFEDQCKVLRVGVRFGFRILV